MNQIAVWICMASILLSSCSGKLRSDHARSYHAPDYSYPFPGKEEDWIYLTPEAPDAVYSRQIRLRGRQTNYRLRLTTKPVPSYRHFN
ncbi:MAG: hypothetical protein AAF585_14055, partial [Verrucomicrobiota bacterium]